MKERKATRRAIVGRPRVEGAGFGAIVVDQRPVEHDIYIRLDGAVKKRRKRLSKEVYGTSHVVSLAEAREIYEDGARLLVIGGGYSGMLRLSDEAAEYFAQHGCEVETAPTPAAAHAWNDTPGPAIGLFHVTC
jgi:hypothetical protein